MSFHIYSSVDYGALPEYREDGFLNDPLLYRPSVPLQHAVNVALNLGKPLLLTGEPGTGKTQLAWSIARRLNLGDPLVFNTRTTSAAGDLFYRYNAIGHFQSAQQKQGQLSDDEVERLFIRYQALGQAIRSNARKVVLIDEIDKAPRDLSNDILNVLEEMSFEVPEIGKTYRSSQELRPVLVLTSNSEKNLPDAFLRRCVYFHIPFPGEEELEAILTAKIKDPLYTPDVIRTAVVPHFMSLRKLLQRKKPGTAELLHWIAVLTKLRLDPMVIRNHTHLHPGDRDMLMMTYHVLAKNEQDLGLLRMQLGYPF
ncbi:MAG: ATPase [Bacteroidetes bacterium]|nr:MAG: ATPase [Bacteroidota bacterium]